MRTAARTKGQRSQVSISYNIPAPVGGWNARDSFDGMDIKDAVVMVNVDPLTTETALRMGMESYVTGLPGEVESLMPYSGSSTDILIAASGTAFYDVTNDGAVGAAVVTGLTNARWQSANITTSGGSFMMCANGVDKPELFNGSAWVAIDGVSTPAITGITTTKLNNPIVHKNRLWFTETGTLKTWYLPVQSVGGAANSIDMSAVAQMGGYIVSHCTWTIDAGVGVDDHYVAVTSNGEVIVYKGTDPSSSTTWALVGVWRLGAPVGDRCLYKFAGDILMISQDGVIPLSGALQSSRVNPKVAITDKIQFAMSEAVTQYGSNYGWELMYFARGNKLVLNVPVNTGAQEQYVMNTITKAWTRYTSWFANCWCVMDDQPYYGGTGVVYRGFYGRNDDGENITGYAIPAFSYFGTPVNKRFTMVKPVIRTDGNPSIYAGINVNYDLRDSTEPLSFSSVDYAAWDVALWDTGVWGGGLNVTSDWQDASGIGETGSIYFKIAAKNIDIRWISSIIVYEAGGML